MIIQIRKCLKSLKETFIEEPIVEVITQEKGKFKTSGVKYNLEKQPMVMPKVDRVPKFVQERPPPCFPQRISKFKEEQ